MDSTEWGRRVLAVAMRRLRPRLARGLHLNGCSYTRRGEWWTVRLHGRWEGLAGGPRNVNGSGRVRLGRALLPGDPRIGRALHLALAAALAEVAQSSGLGLRMCRWTVRPASCGPRTAGDRGAGRRV